MLGDEEPQAALEAGTMASHVQCTGPSSSGRACFMWELLMLVLCHFSRVLLFAALWALGHHAPLSTGFARQGFWCGLRCPPQGDLPDPRMEPMSLDSPEGSLKATREIIWCVIVKKKKMCIFIQCFTAYKANWVLIFFFLSQY